jgi:deoxyribose-phosphate aldolase
LAGFFYFYPEAAAGATILSMDIRRYLDSTYLKTPEQAKLQKSENDAVVENFILEAIGMGFKLIMIRPDQVAHARVLVDKAGSPLKIGTVIGFPEGTASIGNKLAEAEKAIADGADELDFVVNYTAFKNGDTESVKAEIALGTALGLKHMKVVKWIIEVAALDDSQIAQLSALIKNVVVTNFEGHYDEVFVKSSTGFFKTEDGKPNGATPHTIAIMLNNAAPLPVKAAGGVRSFDEAVQMVNMGVKRIGTSSAKAIAEGGKSSGGY